jgi:hypothetical protein
LLELIDDDDVSIDDDVCLVFTDDDDVFVVFINDDVVFFAAASAESPS